MGNRSVLVIDTLRATTTLTTILDRGATKVLTCASLDEAFLYKRQDPTLILGGERHNQPVPGFDAGNSPFDYQSQLVEGRAVILTTTNGTQAVARVNGAGWVGLACLLNAAPAARRQQEQKSEGLVVCAGTVGQVSWEDVLTAGAVINEWPERAWTDAARLAWTAFSANQTHIAQSIMQSSHAQHLLSSGMARDVAYAARINQSSTVPVRGTDGWFYRNT